MGGNLGALDGRHMEVVVVVEVGRMLLDCRVQ